MNKNKKVLKYCKNFYKIKDYDYDESDFITDKLFSIYEDYIFSIDDTNDVSLKKAEKLDTILGKYINDYEFRKCIKDGVLKIKVNRNCDIHDAIVDALIKLFEIYEEGCTRNIYIARWI